MKTFPYNKSSIKGRRLFKLLGVQHNEGVLDADAESNSFENYDVPTMMQCRTNKVSLLMPSNLSGIKRPQIRINADVEVAWGDFTDDVMSLDFRHDGQELPINYIQPLEDETLKLLIDAGLYRDPRFENLLSKLMSDETFDAEADMGVTFLNIKSDKTSELDEEDEYVPVLLVDPINVMHENYDPSDNTIQDLIKRNAILAIELRKEGYKTEELVQGDTYDQDNEQYISGAFDDVVARYNEDLSSSKLDNSMKTSSELLDAEIDVTDELKGSLGYDYTTEDDLIRELKERERLSYSEAIDEAYEDEDELEWDEDEYFDNIVDENEEEIDDYEDEDELEF